MKGILRYCKDVSIETVLYTPQSVLELLKYIPGDETLTMEPSSKNMKLSWNGGTAAYEVPDVQDYPDIALQES